MMPLRFKPGRVELVKTQHLPIEGALNASTDSARTQALGRFKCQRGAAILTAMLTVTLVAALSAATLWQQWRSIEVETAERERQQAAWVLQGALDWARLILREDARSDSMVDHLAEPWAIPLQEARLSTFLATRESDTTSQGLEEAFLSGSIVDLQGRLNVMNLVKDGKVDMATARAFSRLFETLHLPQNQLANLIAGMQGALESPTPDKDAASAPATGVPYLLPRTVEQLGWLGLSPPVMAVLRPYVTVLPEQGTRINLNTAPAAVLYACIPGSTMADAQRLVAARAQAHFRSLSDVSNLLGGPNTAISDALHSVNSRYFEVSGQVRLGDRAVLEHSLVRRDNPKVTVVWRERGPGSTGSPNASLQ